MRSLRYNKFIQFLKPPSPSFNKSKKQILRLIHKFNTDAKILDIGCGNRRLSRNVINFDIEKQKNIDIVGDGHYLPFKENTFDLIICQAVLEHVRYPFQIVNDIYYILKPGGVVYAEVPFLQGYHADPHDYNRYTLNGIKNLFVKFKIEDINVSIGPFSVLSWWTRKILTTYFLNKYIILAIEFILGWFTFWIKYLDLLTLKAKNLHILAGGFSLIGKKP